MKDSTKINSGVVTESTKFVFRSRSARIIWLVQISAEMFDFDQVDIALMIYLITIVIYQF